MNIVKYERIKKDTYNIYLSNGEVITLKEKVITDNELLLKKKIDKDLYDKLLIDNNIYLLEESSIKYINIRLRSEKEIRDYLLKKTSSIEEIDKVINNLKSLGYIDDVRFTKAYINDKLNFTLVGDFKLKLNLESLGIANDIITSCMSSIEDNVFTERINKIISKDILKNKKYSGITLKNKIYNHLLSQGYSKERVISIVNNYDF